MINKINETLPMIADALAQWCWFRDSNHLARFDAGNVGPGKTSRTYPSSKDKATQLCTNLLAKHRMDAYIKETEILWSRLVETQKRFEALRERAK